LEVLTRRTTDVIQAIQSYESVVLGISAEPIFCLLRPFSLCFRLPPIIPIVHHRAHHSVCPFVFSNYFCNRTDVLPGISRFLAPPVSPLDFGSSRLTFLCSDAPAFCKSSVFFLPDTIGPACMYLMSLTPLNTFPQILIHATFLVCCQYYLLTQLLTFS
jgi:hypothetical protein